MLVLVLILLVVRIGEATCPTATWRPLPKGAALGAETEEAGGGSGGGFGDLEELLWHVQITPARHQIGWLVEF